MGNDVKRPVQCPNCDKRLSAPQSYEGRKLKCPQCGTTFPCVFAAGPVAPVAATHVPSAFRMIEVETEPKRSAAAEIGRLGLGLVGAAVGGIVGGVAWVALSIGIGYAIGLIGAPVIGALSGLGMRLGYGRAGDVAAGVIAAAVGVIAFGLAWVLLTQGQSGRLPILAAIFALSTGFTIASGISFGGDD